MSAHGRTYKEAAVRQRKQVASPTVSIVIPVFQLHTHLPTPIGRAATCAAQAISAHNSPGGTDKQNHSHMHEN
jgi:hypothetical protein